VTEIHPRAIVAHSAAIGERVRIGPWCQVGGHVQIGDDAELVSHVVLDGDTSIGAGVKLFPFCTVGLAPQDLKYRGEKTRCEIGPRTVVREHVTIHRGTVTGSGITRVGADCLLMAVVHVAHDCVLGDGVIVANNVVMGGHVMIGDRAVIGGAAALHQFVRIGAGAMIGGMSGVEADVIPFGSVMGNRARLVGLNLVQLKRRGFERARIHALRSAFRTLFGGDGTFAERHAALRASAAAEEPLVAEMLAFVEAPSKRGLVRARLGAEALDDDGG
jgi:UDP-N-acetylglucosamine acyltransferase